ncbi:hypothetical protein AVEN_107931-1 [Araneus ventricosus]|uniref:Uncharacterized protein n=1 Tax=Araneus ventricosus TaxID=182803 RepID=A0A4Y2KZF7_ARAVE|nr:hypothetical protein AVEN_107931-1 [Araneus ventricosus]
MQKSSRDISSLALKKPRLDTPELIRCSSIPIHTCAGISAERRPTWCNFVMNKLEDHPTFLTDIISTEEAYFSSTGMFNRQNVHTWSLENPRYAIKFRHQLRWSINVWCGIFNERLIGPVFYEETLTGQRYLELLQDVITDFVENLPLHHLRNVFPTYQRHSAQDFKS